MIVAHFILFTIIKYCNFSFQNDRSVVTTMYQQCTQWTVLVHPVSTIIIMPTSQKLGGKGYLVSLKVSLVCGGGPVHSINESVYYILRDGLRYKLHTCKQFTGRIPLSTHSCFGSVHSCRVLISNSIMGPLLEVLLFAP